MSMKDCFDQESCLELKEIQVPVEKLYLDPRNPRLRSDVFEDQQYSDKDILDKYIQDKVMMEMMKPEFQIDDLIDSIKSKGFVNIDSVFVKNIEGTDCYLVVEGNRRTTALKKLLNRKDHLHTDLVESIEVIPAKELLVDDTEIAHEQIDFILGMRHHGGIKMWGAMQRAHSIYKRYKKLYDKEYGDDTEFIYNPEVAKKVGNGFNIALGDVRIALQVYRVYEQLKSNGYPILPTHYSLIEAGITKKRLRDEYFEQNSSDYLISKEGMERFSILCLEEDSVITNPKLFSQFSFVYQNGTDYEIKVIENGERDPDDIKRRIDERISRQEFYEALENIYDQINELVISDYKGLQKEKNLIDKIKKAVQNKLARLS
jgi:hypothetical protein